MAFLPQYVDGGVGVIYTGSGCLTREDLINSARVLRSPDEDAKVRYVLVDNSEIQEVSLTAEDIRDLARENESAPSARSGRLIAVAAPSDHMFGISRMWQMLVEKLGWGVQIFRTREEAVACIRSRFPEARLEPVDPKPT